MTARFALGLIGAALVAVLVGLRLGVDRRDEFSIRRGRDGRTVVRGRLATAKAGAIRAFFDDDLADAGRFQLRGYWPAGRALQLRWRGHLSTRDRQRARNFLIEHLR